MLSTVALGALLSASCGTGVDDEAVPTSTVAATPTATGVPVALAVPRAIPKRTSTLVAQLAPPTAASPTPRVVATPTQTPIPATTRPLRPSPTAVGAATATPTPTRTPPAAHPPATSVASTPVPPSPGVLIPDCSTDLSSPLFDVSPVQMSDLLGIVPLGNMAPPQHTFPTQHLYFFIRRAGPDPTDFNSPPAIVPVFAPGRIWLTSVATSEHLSASPPFTDYSFSFQPCRQFQAYFIHVQSLTDSLLEEIGAFDVGRCNSYSTGGESFRRCEKRVAIEMQAGEQIGTTGRTGQNALDFGAYDGRVAPLEYANPSRHRSAPDGFDQLHVVYAIDYYRPDVGDELRSRLGVHSQGRPRTVQPVCGEVEQDRPGTAQGKWYRLGVAESFPEDPHLALVHDNVDPTIGAFSIGASFPGLGSGVYHFTPQDSGRVNLDFGGVSADGGRYCYDALSVRGGPVTPPRTIILELTTDESLRIEAQDAAACGSGPWTFLSDPAEFER